MLVQLRRLGHVPFESSAEGHGNPNELYQTPSTLGQPTPPRRANLILQPRSLQEINKHHMAIKQLVSIAEMSVRARDQVPEERRRLLKAWLGDVGRLIWCLIRRREFWSFCFLAGLGLCISISLLSNMPLILRPSRRTLLDSAQAPAHPQSDYRVVRFTLRLPNGQAGADQQPVELCFHSNFSASPLRPILLHFDQSNITPYTRSSGRDAAAAVDLGLVHVSPDDPHFMELLQEQIQREIGEYQERCRAEVRRCCDQRHRSLLRLLQNFEACTDLESYVITRINDEDIGWWLATNKSDHRGLRMFGDVEFCGISIKHTRQLYIRALELNRLVGYQFQDLSPDLFRWWMDRMVRSLRMIMGSSHSAAWTPADDMFIAQGNVSRWVLRQSLPPKIPPGITSILRSYTFWLTHHRDHHFSSTCQILRDCSSAPPFPKLQHPSCSRHDTLEDTMKHLNSWAQEARSRNRNDEDILGNIRWPGVLDLPRNVAQLVDAVEQSIQLAESMERMPVITTVSFKGWLKRTRSSFYLWPKKHEPQDPSNKTARARELLDTRLRRMLHDVSQDLRLMHSICDDWNALTDFIDSLHSQTNWIINEDGPFVELLQMPPPSKQSAYLAGLTEELSTRLEKSKEFWSEWYWWKNGEKNRSEDGV
ncbi:uncharacterized protein BKA55DRAFT_695579 [Fusarium redolens]|uniref:Uncharacterized protein n=1 Tax=Fusarium redolens TaxID=48865 RepID=A0A9P9JU08_FUSRE|nr:uncharacterized protein BKA55DRAFT_695579 [Fusarium redolens]KAH7232155.1 hypothetical protein BKA55DRAFT_695579 [Fusarium redolens]